MAWLPGKKARICRWQELLSERRVAAGCSCGCWLLVAGCWLLHAAANHAANPAAGKPRGRLLSSGQPQQLEHCALCAAQEVAAGHRSAQWHQYGSATA
eukprot:COSAG01_NODE_10036_length_2268_cov_2.751037_2_plen_98_part_00